jgi:hypothetical protein
VPLIVIQRQLGHSNLGITSVSTADDSGQRLRPTLITGQARRRSSRKAQV